ncbi:hypothetical protein T03_14815 [Trichinella britovi]|uniref:Uncharacterized protein n=1 Tax=Trichinella britovi TaxID=45882 RepID=A0A0V0YZ27_TRIBR|nr:hypothetical protein T03_14815 [Trichinella britovi]
MKASVVIAELVWSTWGQTFTAFSYWSLNSLFHLTFNSSSYWFSLSNCSLIQTLQL